MLIMQRHAHYANETLIIQIKHARYANETPYLSKNQSFDVNDK